MIASSGTNWRTPSAGSADCGHQPWPARVTPALAIDPIASPPATAPAIDVRLPMSAAPSAGTTSRISWLGWVRCRKTMPAIPANTADSTQLAPASSCGL